jgi:hypothetical protein
MTSRIDSKVLPNAVTTANRDFFLNRAKNVPISCSLHGAHAAEVSITCTQDGTATAGGSVDFNVTITNLSSSTIFLTGSRGSAPSTLSVDVTNFGIYLQLNSPVSLGPGQSLKNVGSHWSRSPFQPDTRDRNYRPHGFGEPPKPIRKDASQRWYQRPDRIVQQHSTAALVAPRRAKRSFGN